MLKRGDLEGVFPAIVTPFSQDGRSVDFDSLRKLIDFQLAAGVHGVVVNGSTGEAMTLNDKEYSQVVVETVKHVAKRCAVIAGVGSNNTARAVELAEISKSSGAAGVLVVVPFYNKPSQQGIYEHIKAVSQSVKLPVIAYNVPGRTVANMLPETVARLSREKLIVGLKEASGSIDQLLDILALVRNDIAVLIGECSMFNAALACGCVGTISASANIVPKKFVQIFETFKRAEFERAKELQFEILALIRAVFCETNPVPVKAALKLLGVISHDTVRLPLLAAQSSTVERFKALELERFI